LHRGSRELGHLDPYSGLKLGVVGEAEAWRNADGSVAAWRWQERMTCGLRVRAVVVFAGAGARVWRWRRGLR
jgi:hypothetical protein